MLIEKEVIAPGNYWYVDEVSQLPRRLDVTPELTRYWHEQGNAMLSAGLPVPIPCEHDFKAHPMTPREKLLNNSGEVKEYKMRGDTLWSVCDIQDEDVRKKIGGTIKWTSPWITSFTDGSGKKWDNVIAHLALTTRPRITKQAPFESIAAALSMATTMTKSGSTIAIPKEGICLSRAGRLVTRKRDGRLRPQYPMAFSLFSGGAKFGPDDDAMELGDDGGLPPKKKKKPLAAAGAAPKPPAAPKPDVLGDEDEDDTVGGDELDDIGGGGGLDESLGGGSEPPPGGEKTPGGLPLNPLADPSNDVKMEELLCDLLSALGIQMPDNVGPAEFKRALYEAAMAKTKELTSKAQAGGGDQGAAAAGANTASPAGGAGGGAGGNPLIQQEQQPMYMSLEQINELPEPMKSFALAMHAENQKLTARLDASQKVTDSLRDAKIKEATKERATRISLLGRLSPGMKTDLDAMAAQPSMAMSMGDGGAVVDPMAQTLAMLEKGVASIPRLLTADTASLSIQAQPSDDEMTDEVSDKISDDLARMMGCAERKAS